MDRLTELRCSADDLAEQVRDLQDGFDFEPGELDELESRLDVIYRLKKKGGGVAGGGEGWGDSVLHRYHFQLEKGSEQSDGGGPAAG